MCSQSQMSLAQSSPAGGLPLPTPKLILLIAAIVISKLLFRCQLSLTWSWPAIYAANCMPSNWQ